MPHRANLVARIPGSGGGPRLCLLSHTDTVLADPAEWRRDPWSGDLVDGEIWGRGALDMKGQVAAAAVTLASLARDGFRPEGDLIFVAAADEEVGDDFGLQWLVREHPEAVRCEYALNEGAGDRVELGGKTMYLCAAAEKMTAPFVIRTRGRSGHGSMPGLADNALLKAAPLVGRISAYRPERSHGPETEGFFRVLTGEVPPADEAVEAARAIHPLAGDLIEPLLQMTFAPTMISASQKRNVIPAVCEVVVDCRLRPGQTPADAEAAMREALGEGEWEYEPISAQGGTRSPLDTPLWSAIEAFVGEAEPGARVAPVCCAGFTDSHWLRTAFGTVAYGFFPARMDPELMSRLIHSADERALVDDLELGVEFFRHAARTVLG